jgi:pimeloyl-ACP methyl ester carboxylesterase
MVAKEDDRPAWMGIDWSEHLRWVEVQGRYANVLDLGSGPPVVFVHGLSGSWQNWLEQLPEFARTHRVVAMDLPGFGASPMPRERITISGYGRWLDALLEELGVAGAAIVGNSMGGFVGAETAIKFPHRVERLVLVAAAGLSVEHQRSDGLLRLLEVTENVSQLLAARLFSKADGLISRPRGRRALLWFVAAHPEQIPAALAREQLRGANKPGFVPALDALTSYPIRDRLGDVRCPTLLVWGPKDVLVPVGDAYEFDRLIPDSRLVVYEDTGHVPMLERPERFNADLRAFLDEQPAGDAERVAAAAAQQEPEPAEVDAGE